MTTTEPDLDPTAAGLPSETELLKLASELYGDTATAASAPSAGTDWAGIAADVLRAEAAAPAAAYSPTLVSAKNAGAATAATAARSGNFPNVP